MAGVANITVGEDEAGMRLDRWFKAHYPGLSHVALQKLARSGQLRLDGKRCDPSDRIQPGMVVRATSPKVPMCGSPDGP